MQKKLRIWSRLYATVFRCLNERMFFSKKKNMNIAFQDEMTKKPPSCHLPCIHGED